MSETMQDDQPVVMEDTEEDRARMAALDAAIAEHGIQGGEPDEGTRGLGSAQTMIAEAKKHLGYRESGDNDAKFNHWLGAIRGFPFPHDGFGYPWCHCFVSYCLGHSDNAGAGPKTAGCNAGVDWFNARALLGAAARRRPRLLRRTAAARTSSSSSASAPTHRHHRRQHVRRRGARRRRCSTATASTRRRSS